MQIPFTIDAFFRVFESYNTAIWPLQLFVYGVAFLLLYLNLKKSPYFERSAFYALAFFWLLNGAGYHLLFFSAINKAAFLFGSLFILQALVFAWKAYKTPLSITEVGTFRGAVAWALMLYAMFFYSILGYFAGHQYPAAPIFGVAPCPTTIFTFGILISTAGRLRWFEYLIPLLWAVVGTSAAFTLGVREDLGLAAAAILFLALQLGKH